MSRQPRQPRVIVPVLIGLMGLSAPGWARHTDATQPTPAQGSNQPPSGVAIDIDPQLPNAEVTRGWVLERTHDVVGGLGAPIEPGALIQVVLGGASRDYRISVVLLQDGVALSDSLQPAPVVCECGSDEMLDRIAGAIEDGAKTLADVAARERAAEAAALADARQQAERKRIEDEEKEKQRAAARQAALEQAPYRPTRLGWAGVGALALGGAMSITGTVMLTRQGAVGSRASYLHVERNWVPPGGALLGTGLVAVVVGTSLLVVDAVRCRRDPARCVHEDDLAGRMRRVVTYRGGGWR